MSKAKNLSRQYVLPFLDKQYEKYGEHRQMQLSKFDGFDLMSAYEDGYRQAEKDLALTWEDISIIRQIMFDYNRTIRNGMPIPSNENYCKEVLNRFNKQKGK